MQNTATLHANEEYTMPCAEALLAATMALMTGHVQACCVAHRDAMAGKIVSNLSALVDEPMLSPGFKNLLNALRNRWQCQTTSVVVDQLPVTERVLRHSCPQTVQ